MLPLVLLHGFPFDSTLWAPVRALLSPELVVYAPDLPGFGQMPPLEAPLSIERLADWLAHWLTERGVDQAVVAGHSMGGYVALAFKARYGNRVRGLGLLHSMADPDSPEKRLSRDAQVAHLRANGAAWLAPRLITPLVAEAHAEELRASLAVFVDKAAALPIETLIATIGALRDRLDTTAVLRKPQPLLLLGGALDPVVSLATLDCHVALSGQPAAVCRVVLPTAAHLGMLEEPAAVAAALEQLVGVATLAVPN
jgi:pimeloyl-ACP methyl ester carboxylesterase